MRTPNNFAFSILTILITIQLNAQELKWAHGVGSTGSDRLWRMELDNNGRLIGVGEFSGTVDVDPGPAVVNLTAVGSTDILLYAMDTSGTFLWARGMGGSGQENGRAVQVDNFGNIYITGSFRNTVDFDPGPGVSNLTSNGGSDVFFSKFDPFGNLVWVKSFGGTGDDQPLDLAFTANLEVVISGQYRNSVDFDPNSGVQTKTALGAQDIFLCKYDNNGNLLWVNTYGSIAANEGGNKIVIDSNQNILFVGRFGGTIDFDTGTGITNVSSLGGTDAFVCKVDQSGAFIWVKTYRGSMDVRNHDIIINDEHDIYISGSFRGSVDFDPNMGVNNKTSAGSWDGHITKLDSNGNLIWVKVLAAASAEAARSLALDKDGYLYVTGYYFIGTDFDPGPNTYNLSALGTSGDSFVWQLDSNGDFVWASQCIQQA